MNDAEWNDLYERARLEVECQVLAAEAAVERAKTADIDLRITIRQYPHEPKVARLIDSVRRLAAHRANLPAQEWEPRLAGMHVEDAVYTWRRDFGEWPSRYNLADRLARMTGLTHRQAERRILATISAADDGYQVHCIRAIRLREILTDADLGAGPWNDGGETDLRFYLLAEAQDRYVSDYTQGYLAEAVA